MKRDKFILIVWLFLIIIRVLLFFFQRKYFYILFYEDIYVYINITIILLTSILLINLIVNENKRKRLSKTILTLYLVTLILTFIIYHFIGIALSEPTARYFYSSPNDKNTLLLEEKENITGVTIDGYKVIWGMFKVDTWPKYDTRISFSEPDTPIKNGNYRISWIDDSKVEVTINSDSHEETLKLNFE